MIITSPYVTKPTCQAHLWLGACCMLAGYGTTAGVPNMLLPPGCMVPGHMSTDLKRHEETPNPKKPHTLTPLTQVSPSAMELHVCTPSLDVAPWLEGLVGAAAVQLYGQHDVTVELVRGRHDGSADHEVMHAGGHVLVERGTCGGGGKCGGGTCGDKGEEGKGKKVG